MKKNIFLIGAIVVIIGLTIGAFVYQNNIEKSIINHEQQDKELPNSVTYIEDISVEFSEYKRYSSKNSKKYYAVFKGEEIVKGKTSYWVRIKAADKREERFKDSTNIAVYKKDTLFSDDYYVYIDGEVHFTRIKK